MKRIKFLLVSILLLSAGASGAAWAQHYHHGARVGIHLGLPLGWGWYYPPPYPYFSPAPYAPALVAPSAPPVYVEQVPQAAQPDSSYWYYCNKPDGYYPYVKQCPGGWQRVAPHPPSQLNQERPQ